jgi:hypothetical protein
VARTYLDKFNERNAWIASALKTAGSRQEFDASAAANKIDFASVVEEEIKASATLDDYKKMFNDFINDQPIVVYTYDTLEWVVDSPPELHLVRHFA